MPKSIQSDMLRLWGYTETATCPLCGANQCTLHHILVNCKFSLDQGRYTWRHDSVLFEIEQALLKLIPMVNDKKPTCFAEIARKDFKSCFIREGERRKTVKIQNNRRASLISLMTGRCKWISKTENLCSLPLFARQTSDRTQ